MLKATAKFIGRMFTRPTDGCPNSMDVTMISADFDSSRKSPGTIHMDVEGLKEEGIKEISFKVGYDEFTIRIERIDGKITLIEKENDNKSLIIESGFVFDDKGRKSYTPNEYRTQKFPSVFGKR